VDGVREVERASGAMTSAPPGPVGTLGHGGPRGSLVEKVVAALRERPDGERVAELRVARTERRPVDRTWPIAILVAALVALVVASWFPFRPELPWEPRRGPDTTSAGEVRFNGSSVLVSPPGVDWVADAAASGSLRLAFDARTDVTDQRGPARLLSISRDTLEADLMIGQDGDDLVLRVRRSDSDLSGDPAFGIADVFSLAALGRWRHVVVDLQGGRVTVEVDGVVVVDEPAEPTGWDPAYRLSLGDEAAGRRGWVGELRNVEATTPDHHVDVLASGQVDDGSGIVWRDRVRSLRSLNSHDPLALTVVRFAVFVPVGLALGLLLRRRWALIGVVGISLALVAGKLFVADRHPRLGDAIVCVLGGLAGLALAARGQRPTPSDAPEPTQAPPTAERSTAERSTAERSTGPASTNQSSSSEGSSSSSLSST